MNDILKREQEEFEKIKPDFLSVKNNEWWASDEDYIKDFLKASNKRVALEVLGRVMKVVLKDKELPSSLGEEFYKQESVPEYKSRIKSAIEEEMGRWK